MRKMWCHTRTGDSLDGLMKVVDKLEISELQKTLLEKRVITRLNKISYRSRWYGQVYVGFRVFVTVGALLIPALISIRDGTNLDIGI